MFGWRDRKKKKQERDITLKPAEPGAKLPNLLNEVFNDQNGQDYKSWIQAADRVNQMTTVIDSVEKLASTLNRARTHSNLQYSVNLANDYNKETHWVSKLPFQSIEQNIKSLQIPDFERPILKILGKVELMTAIRAGQEHYNSMTRSKDMDQAAQYRNFVIKICKKYDFDQDVYHRAINEMESGAHRHKLDLSPGIEALNKICNEFKEASKKWQDDFARNPDMAAGQIPAMLSQFEKKFRDVIISQSSEPAVTDDKPKHRVKTTFGTIYSP